MRVLVVGGGVAALETLFALHAFAGALVDVELVAPEPRFFYRPQAVLEPFGGGRVQTFPLTEIAAATGARLTTAEVASVSAAQRVVRTTRGMQIEYDALVVATGASPRAVLNAAITFRGPAESESIAALGRDAAGGKVERVALAIPSVRTWPLPVYELAFGLRDAAAVPIVILTPENAPGAVLGSAGSSYLAELLARREIDVVTRYAFAQGSDPAITVAAPELVAARIYGLPADDDGFIPVNRFGAVAGLDDVYAAGDVTSYEVKHGSLAAAQADVVARAIAARAGADIVQVPFRPVLHARIACGDGGLFVRRNVDHPSDPGVVSRDPLWAPGSKIFARYLTPGLAELARRRSTERVF